MSAPTEISSSRVAITSGCTAVAGLGSRAGVAGRASSRQLEASSHPYSVLRQPVGRSIELTSPRAREVGQFVAGSQQTIENRTKTKKQRRTEASTKER